VIERARALGDFANLTADGAQDLAGRYALDYLVTEQALALPLAYSNSQFRIYRLHRSVDSPALQREATPAADPGARRLAR
jgi:hypothetical protein